MSTASSTARPSAVATLHESFQELPIDSILRSLTNPRTHFDPLYVTQLAQSIAEKGLIQPIVVRPLPPTKEIRGSAFEIVAGECRWRACQLAGLDRVPTIIRSYTDEQVLEIQLVENIHRTDLTPLEAARGYRRLIDSNPDKHSAATIAARIGMSVGYVWDRLKLLDLIPEAQQLLEDERISVAHAIVIARQKPADQQRIIKPPTRSQYNARHSALWVDEHADFDFDEDKDPKAQKDPYHGYKPTTVRELERWITDNIRFDVEHAAKAQPLVFEETAATVATAAARPGRGKKVIEITFDYGCPDGAKSPTERTYGHRSWRFADGREHASPDGRGKAKVWGTCEYSVLGVVVAGQGQGEAFEVCIAKDRCQTHWGAEIREKQKTQKLRESGQTAKADKREAERAERQRRERERNEAREKRWDKLHPKISKAAREAARGVTTVTGDLYAHVLKFHDLPANTKPEDLAKALLVQAVAGTFRTWSWHGEESEWTAFATALGVDVKALAASVEAKPKGAKKAKPAKRKQR